MALTKATVLMKLMLLMPSTLDGGIGLWLTHIRMEVEHLKSSTELCTSVLNLSCLNRCQSSWRTDVSNAAQCRLLCFELGPYRVRECEVDCVKLINLLICLRDSKFLR